MLKALFISANLVALAALPFLFVGEVEITHVATSSQVEAGSELEVEITINKGGISGPCRLKLDLSDATDVTIEAVEKSGANFTTKEGSATFIWSSAPSDEILTLKYKILTASIAAGTKTITGSFGYLNESERAKEDLPSLVFDVTGGTVASSTDPDPVTTPDPVATQDPTEVVKCLRVVEKDGDDFIVTINIEKADYEGFARAKDKVPAGFSATKIESDGAVFKFVDDAAKFLWTNLPKKENVKVVYKLSPDGATAGDYSIDGEFSGEFLVVNDVPKKVTIPTSFFTVDGGGDLVITDPVDTDPKDPVDVEPKNNGGTDVSTPTVAGIVYKVQILAAHKTVSNKYIKKKYGYSGNVELFNHEGWVKYLTGSYDVYKDARDKRESLSKYELPGPFVTAYNSGERITVQEALTITKQDWVQ